MFAQVTVGISDIDRAVAFYRPLMEALGWEEVFATRNPPGPWAGWAMPDTERPLFIIAVPADGDTPEPGNGPSVAFELPGPEAVDQAYALALDLGGIEAPAPGLREAHHGACFRDPDGNVICLLSYDDP